MENRSEKQDSMDINSLSITELKQLLSRVNQDINSIKRAERRAKKIAVNNTVSELAECNIIAKRFTGKIIPAPIQNAKLIADIQIQKDILDFLNNGGRIITAKRRKVSKAFTVSLSNQVSL
jgi:hypothetical protein